MFGKSVGIFIYFFGIWNGKKDMICLETAKNQMEIIFNEFNFLCSAGIAPGARSIYRAGNLGCNLAAFEHIGIPWSSIVFPSVRDV